jgi:hypothetical protein
MIRERLIPFIDERVPGFAAKIRGADEQSVALLEQRCSSRLPSVYRDFLALMWEDTAGFDVIPGYAYRASELLAYHPTPETELAYDPRRYHKIAICCDEEREDFVDFFLDLELGDEEDAPIVRFEDDSGVPAWDRGEPPEPRNTGRWFGDSLQLGALNEYELNRRAHQLRLSVTSRFTPENKAVWTDQGAWWSEVCGYLAAWKLPQPLRGRAFFCGVGAGTIVTAERPTHGAFPIVVRLASDDRSELYRRGEQIRDQFAVVGEEGRNESLEDVEGDD